MKNKFYILLTGTFFIAATLNAQNKPDADLYANTSLSNLASPTKIKINLLPDKDDAHNLGNSDKAWRSLYLDSVLYLRGKPFIKIPDALSRNTIVGINAMYNDDFSNSNTAIGYSVLYSNTDGAENTAAGVLAMAANTTGYSNTAIGYDALNHNTTGHFNTAIGYDAIYNDSSGSYNTGIGHYVLHSNTKGSENVAVGDSAAYSQNTNLYMNTAIGARALLNNTTGTANTACGSFALYENKATNNSAFGNAALYNNSKGSGNTAIGNSAGSNITTGTNNTFLGAFTNSGSAGAGNNMTAVGNGAYVNSNNHVVIGNSSVTSIGGFANWSNLSDGRVKKNIKQNVPGLSFINKLQPVTYNLDLDAADKISGHPVLKDKDEKIIQPSQTELESRKAKEQIIYTGFVAQDVEKAAQSLNYDFSGVDKPDNANTLYGLRYSDFVVPLVKAVQELSTQNDSLKSEIGNLKSEMENIKAMLALNKLPAGNQQVSNSSSTGGVWEEVALSQNIPNPFPNSTTINYSLPQHFSSAKILVVDESGKTIKSFDLSGAGKGSINFSPSFRVGASYQYSLYVDGRLIDTKQMILSK